MLPNQGAKRGQGLVDALEWGKSTYGVQVGHDRRGRQIIELRIGEVLVGGWEAQGRGKRQHVGKQPDTGAVRGNERRLQVWIIGERDTQLNRDPLDDEVIADVDRG